MVNLELGSNDIYIVLQNGLYTILVMYIDVLLLIGDIELEFKLIKDDLMSSFKLTYLGALGIKHYNFKK